MTNLDNVLGQAQDAGTTQLFEGTGPALQRAGFRVSVRHAKGRGRSSLADVKLPGATLLHLLPPLLHPSLPIGPVLRGLRLLFGRQH